MTPANSLLAAFGLVVTSLLASSGESFAGGQGDPRVYGTWDLFEVQGNGMVARVRLTVGKDRVSSSSTCSFDGKRVQVQTVSSALITDNEILIMEDSEAQAEHSPGFLNCKASMDEGSISYQLVNGNLVLQMAGHNEKIQLSRSGGAFIQARRLAGTSIQTR